MAKDVRQRIARAQQVWQEGDASRMNRRGIVIRVLWSDSEILVMWEGGETAAFDFDDFEGCWHDSFGWLIGELANGPDWYHYHRLRRLNSTVNGVPKLSGFLAGLQVQDKSQQV